MAGYYGFMLGVRATVFSFPEDNMTSLGMCINIVQIWFGIAKWHILSIIDRLICPPHDRGRVLSFHIFIPHHTIVAGYYGFTLVVRVSTRVSVRRMSVHPNEMMVM